MSKLWSSVLVFVVTGLIGLNSAAAADGPKKKGERAERKRPTAEQIFKKLDADKDGKLTAAEFLKTPRVKDEATAKKLIARMDANKDGSVCAKEFAEAFKKRHAERAEREKKGEGERKKGGKKRGEKKEGPKETSAESCQSGCGG